MYEFAKAFNASNTCAGVTSWLVATGGHTAAGHRIRFKLRFELSTRKARYDENPVSGLLGYKYGPTEFLHVYRRTSDFPTRDTNHDTE